MKNNEFLDINLVYLPYCDDLIWFKMYFNITTQLKIKMIDNFIERIWVWKFENLLFSTDFLVCNCGVAKGETCPPPSSDRSTVRIYNVIKRIILCIMPFWYVKVLKKKVLKTSPE